MNWWHSYCQGCWFESHCVEQSGIAVCLKRKDLLTENISQLCLSHILSKGPSKRFKITFINIAVVWMWSSALILGNLAIQSRHNPSLLSWLGTNSRSTLVWDPPTYGCVTISGQHRFKLAVHCRCTSNVVCFCWKFPLKDAPWTKWSQNQAMMSLSWCF